MSPSRTLRKDVLATSTSNQVAQVVAEGIVEGLEVVQIDEIRAPCARCGAGAPRCKRSSRRRLGNEVSGSWKARLRIASSAALFADITVYP